MNLQDISDIYQKNLITFFNNEKVIEAIYKEQYGEENYKKNKETYHKQYKEIMKNTVFIPYVTLDHLERFIIPLRKRYGDNFVEKNFSSELSLIKKLNVEKKNIIKNYSSFMLEDLKQIFPKLTAHEYNKILKECKNSNFDENANLIKETLLSNHQSLFSKFKKAKLNKCINKYKKLAEDKILMETTSYFKHTSDIPNGKYYPDTLMNNLKSNYSSVTLKISKDSNRNIRYIYLPVLIYESEEEYLKDAVHEVMHISKEKIYKNKYISGLHEREISKSKNHPKLTTIYDSLFKKVAQLIKWSKIVNTSQTKIYESKYISEPTINNSFFKNIAQSLRFKADTSNIIPQRKKSYETVLGVKSLEEVTHDLQSKKVVLQIMNSESINLLKMPYKKKRTYESFVCPYDYFDTSTQKFMIHFKKDIQNINNGQLSVKRFKRKVGNSNFDLYAHAAYLCTTDGAKNKEFYTNIGNNLVDKMVSNSEKKAKILDKTQNLPMSKIASFGEFLQKKFEHKKEDIVDNSLVR